MPPDAGAIPIDLPHLALSAVLVLAAGLVSISLRLGIEKRLAVAGLRTVVQLLLVGYVLGWVFALRQPFLVLALVTLMIATASRAAVRRSTHRYRGVHLVAFGTLTLTGLATTLGTTQLIIGVHPWWRPQYVVPLLGMVLGNGLTGLSLCLDDLLSSFAEQGDRVEAELALGATPWEAARDPLRQAIRRGLIPIINSMSVVGIVVAAGHDDRADPAGRRSPAGRALSDRDHVHDRRLHRVRVHAPRPGHLPPRVQRAPAAPQRAHRTGRRLTAAQASTAGVCSAIARSSGR